MPLLLTCAKTHHCSQSPSAQRSWRPCHPTAVNPFRILNRKFPLHLYWGSLRLESAWVWRSLHPNFGHHSMQSDTFPILRHWLCSVTSAPHKFLIYAVLWLLILGWVNWLKFIKKHQLCSKSSFPQPFSVQWLLEVLLIQESAILALKPGHHC